VNFFGETFAASKSSHWFKHAGFGLGYNNSLTSAIVAQQNMCLKVIIYDNQHGMDWDLLNGELA